MRHGMKKLWMAIAVLVTCVTVANPASASGVTIGLDTSFGTNGVRTHAQPIGVSPTDPADGVIDSSGRLVSLVNFNVGLGEPFEARVGFVVARHTADGLTDMSFGNDGVSAPVASTTGSSLVELPDGTLVVGAVGLGGTTLRAYTTTGAAKTSFGNNGVVYVSRAANIYAQAEIHVKVQGNRLVAALLPSSRFSQPVVTQVHGFTFDGGVDDTYGNDGSVTLQVNTAFQDFILEDIEVTINDELLLMGNAMLAPTQDQINNSSPAMYAAIVVRLTSAGAIDSSFANYGSNPPGHLVVPSSGSPFMEAMRIAVAKTEVPADSNYGKFMVAGRMGTDTATSEIFFARFFANGISDTGFGTSGVLDTNIDAKYRRTRIGDLHMMSNGESRATMFQNATNPERSAVLGITQMGVVSWNTSLSLGAGNTVGINRILAAPGQKFVVLAATDVNARANVYVRIDATGERDAMYGNNGLADVFVKLNAPLTLWLDAVRQTDGTMFMAGTISFYDSSGNSQTSGLIARVAPTGLVDTTFGTNGYVQVDVANISLWINKIDVLPNGKILILLNGTGINVSYARVARLNADGSLDTTFGTSGGFSDVADTYRVVGDPGELAMRMIVETSGHIVVAGTVRDGNFDKFAFMQRMNADGTLDNAFDGTSGIGNGFVTFTFPGEHGFLDVVTHVQGGYVVVGQDADVPFVARVTTNGVLDTTFGSRASPGVQQISIANGRGGVMEGVAQRLAQTSSGNIIVSGNLYDIPSGTSVHFVARLTAGGEPDVSYDGSSGTSDGLVTFTAESDDFEERNYGMNAFEDGSVVLVGLRLLTGQYPSMGLGNGFLIALDSSGRIDTSQGTNGYHLVEYYNGWNALIGVIQASTNELMTFGTSSNGIFQHAIVSRFTVNLVSTVVETPAPVLVPDVPAVVVAPALPSAAPIVAPNVPIAEVSVVAPVTAVAVPTTVVKKLTKPVVLRKKSVSRPTLMKYLKLTMPKGSKVTITVSAKSKRFCTLEKTSIVYARPGKCLVRVTVRPKKGIMRSATTTMVVKK